MRVQCFKETPVIPQLSMRGYVGYDINAACSCISPSKGKGVVQTELAVSLPSGVYATIVPRSRLTVKKFIDVGTGVTNNDYRGEIGVVLFNHSAVDFQSRWGTGSTNSSLRRLKLL